MWPYLLVPLVSSAAAPHLVVVTLDTTRYDATSCGREAVPGSWPEAPAVTPFLCERARSGLVFERAYSHAPSTLNSHVSLFSGLDPHQHAVPRNGAPVPETLPWLPEELERAGYETVGVVAAGALAGDLGMSRGFSSYDDEAPELHGLMFQRRADRVVDAALARVRARDKRKPLFLWVHLYDAHTPYDPPAPFDGKFVPGGNAGVWQGGRQKLGPLQLAIAEGRADPKDVEAVVGLYLGELGFIDQELERLLVGLGAAGILDPGVLVVTADHGETLAESPDYGFSHGSDVGEGATRVPLLVWSRGVALRQPGLVADPVELSALAPTLRVIAGLAAPSADDAWALVGPGPRVPGGWPDRPERRVFVEATRPTEVESSDRWNNLPMARGLVAGGFRVEALPFAGEGPHLVGPGPEGLVPWLWARVVGWDALAPGPTRWEMADSTERALRALGYLEPDPPASGGGAAAPGP